MDILDQDEEDPFEKEEHARYERERKIVKLIKMAFAKLGITIDEYKDYPVLYDEETNREASVYLEDSEIKLSMLLRLKETGLADDFSIEHAKDNLRITFNVNSALDNAI